MYRKNHIIGSIKSQAKVHRFFDVWQVFYFTHGKSEKNFAGIPYCAHIRPSPDKL
jgi:hypothetical protein